MEATVDLDLQQVGVVEEVLQYLDLQDLLMVEMEDLGLKFHQLSKIQHHL
jgi:hypothetical protein